MVQDRLTWVDRGPTQWFRLSSTARSTAASTEATSRRAPDDASKACDRGSSSALTTRRRSCTAASARVFALPTDLGALDRGAAAGPGFVQELEVEQAFGEALFEGGEGFRGAGMGAESGSK